MSELAKAREEQSSLPDGDVRAPSRYMDEDIVSAPPTSAAGALRPANEVMLERIAPTSPMLRRRAFGSLLRVLLSEKGD